MMKYTIEILRRDDEAFYLQYYKPFRLMALQLSPKAFTSTFAEWSAFGDDAWINKLRNPRATTLLAIHKDGLEIRVLSSVTLFAFESNASPVKPSQPMAWYLNGVFTAPEARRKGISSALIAAAKKCAQHQADAQGRCFCLVTDVLTANLEAKLFYDKMGFKVKKATDDEIQMTFGSGPD